MIDAPSSTWFTASPHWHWLIVLHFVIGMLAAGTYFLSAMIDLAGRQDGRRLARLGYFITLALLMVNGVVLIVDLGRPDRFWHLLLENHTLRPLLKPWVPMSVGTWAYPVFGFFALLSCIAAFAEQRRPNWRFAQRLRPPGVIGALVAVPGALLALLVAGYTGVMVSVLNRPVWSDTSMFGMFFVVSAVTMGAALLALCGRWLRVDSQTVAALRRIWTWLLGVQIVVLVALFISLGPAVRGWFNLWGVVMAVGVAVGIVVPLLASRRRKPLFAAGLPVAAVLILAGGVIMRTAIVFVPEVNAP
jgi:protein NrfD